MQLVDGLTPRKPGFDSGPVNVRFMVGKLAVRQVSPPSAVVFPL